MEGSRRANITISNNQGPLGFVVVTRLDGRTVSIGASTLSFCSTITNFIGAG